MSGKKDNAENRGKSGLKNASGETVDQEEKLKRIISGNPMIYTRLDRN